MTDELAHGAGKLLSFRDDSMNGEVIMVEQICIWCEASLPADLEAPAGQQTCPECLSSWMYEEADGEGLATAA